MKKREKVAREKGKTKRAGGGASTKSTKMRVSQSALAATDVKKVNALGDELGLGPVAKPAERAASLPFLVISDDEIEATCAAYDQFGPGRMGGSLDTDAARTMIARGKSYATVDTAKKWLQLWADMRTQGLIPDANTTAAYAETGTDSSALVAGKAAIGLIWSNQIASYQAAMKDKLGATTLPKGGQKSYAIQMSQYMGIYKNSKNIEAAALFINFFVTAPEAGAVLSTNRGVPSSPVVRAAISSQATESDAAVYRIYDAVADRTIPQDPNLPNDQQFVNGLALLGQQVSFGKSTVDKGATDLQALIEQMSKK